MRTPAASKASPGQHRVGPKFHLLLCPVLELSHHTSKAFLHRTSVQSLSTIWDTGGNITLLGFSLQWWICGIRCPLSSLINHKLLVLAFMVLQHVVHPSVPHRVSYSWLIPSFSLSAVLPDHFLTSKASPRAVKSFFTGSCRVTLICLYIPHKSFARRAHKAQTWDKDSAHHNLWVMSAMQLFFSVITCLFQTILFSYLDKLLGSWPLSSEI